MKFQASQHECLLLRISFFALILFLFSNGITQASHIKDESITRAITNVLNLDKIVSGERIDVLTKQGIVTMAGRIDNSMLRRRATELALTVRGVRSVINRIEIWPQSRMDAAIRRDILMALRTAPSLDQYDIQIDVRNGYVFISGTVNSRQEEESCIKLVLGISGVKEVISLIELSSHHTPTDEDIKADIRRRLFWNVWVKENRIDIQVTRGHVILSGRVESLAEKFATVHDAWMAAGTVSVEDQKLIIDWTLHNKMRRRTRYTHKTDMAIKKALRDTFSQDSRIVALEAEISIANGIVTLNGWVDNRSSKRYVGQDAENTVGVRTVKNYLKIRPNKNIK
jgi:osmotically-inducible protein OsmY